MLKNNIKENIDLSGFETKKTLNSDVFDVETKLMLKDVRDYFLEIGAKFLEKSKIEYDTVDYLLTGSMANYNWSEYSDIDLHYVFNYEEADRNTTLISDYFHNITLNFKNTFNLKFKEYDVEFSIQDSNEDYVKNEGVYSIKYDKWLQEPIYVDTQYDVSEIEKYLNLFGDKIKKIVSSYRNKEISEKEYLKQINDILDTISSLRKDGLKDKGEFSEKNIAFKILRRKGIIDKLKKIKNISFGNVLSFNKGNSTSDDDAKPAKAKSDGDYTDGISYSIKGVLYGSLRDAEKKTGEKKSTIAYRVHSKNPKYNNYKMITQNVV